MIFNHISHFSEKVLIALSLTALTACTLSSTAQAKTNTQSNSELLNHPPVLAQAISCPDTINAAFAMEQELNFYANQIPYGYVFTVQEVFDWATAIENLGTAFSYAHSCSYNYQFAQQRDTYYQLAVSLREAAQPSDSYLEEDTTASWNEMCQRPDYVEFCRTQREANSTMFYNMINSLSNL
jgi:hypothetical protein